MKLGTQIRLPDGREATVVYNSLIGVGIKWGLHSPKPEDFEGTNGDTVGHNPPPENFQWEPEALLRNPINGKGFGGFETEECVGEKFEIIKDGIEF